MLEVLAMMPEYIIIVLLHSSSKTCLLASYTVEKSMCCFMTPYILRGKFVAVKDAATLMPATMNMADFSMFVKSPRALK